MSSESDISRIFNLQSTHSQQIRNTNARERIAKLRRFHAAILNRRNDLERALYEDLRKPSAEAGLTELYEVVSEIKHACSNLNQWMRPRRVKNPAVFWGSSAEIRYEPKGLCLIIAPWNYPFQLAVGPVVSAIAAGNCVILKPSEISPATSRFLKELIDATFAENEVAVIEGDRSVATVLLEKPFHHIFFTGSPAVGRIVMQAAAKHLASVTLELGGKSPVIVEESFDLEEAARKIVWGKFINSGQTCVAPDYVLIPRNKERQFLELAKKHVIALYGIAEQSPDYCKIISRSHFDRIKKLMESAIEKGALVESGGGWREDTNFIGPTILSRIPVDSEIMREEIFGPVLPVLPFETLEDALRITNSMHRPLSLYIFSRNSDFTERVLRETCSGGVCINDVAVQFANVHLPFGGINHSGIGNSHGFYGFRAFSHERPVLRQPKRGPITFFYPPYTERMKRWIDLTIKYF